MGACSPVQMLGGVWGPAGAPKETSAHSRRMWSAVGATARPQPSTPTPVLAALLETGLEGNGLRRGSLYTLCNRLLQSQQLPPPSGRTGQRSGRQAPHSPSRAPGSSLFLQPSWFLEMQPQWALLLPAKPAHPLPGGPAGSAEKQAPLSKARGAPDTAPEKPGAEEGKRGHSAGPGPLRGSLPTPRHSDLALPPTHHLTTSLMTPFSTGDRQLGAQHPRQSESNNLILLSFPSIYGE